MTPQQIKELVNELVDLTRSINDLEQRRDDLKAQLISEAGELCRIHAFVPTEGGGKSVTLPGEECMARVVFPARSLKASFKKTDDLFPKIAQAAGDFFKQLFKPQTTCKPVEDFREVAKKYLGPDAPKLINLLEKDSPPTVSLEVTEQWGDDFP